MTWADSVTALAPWAWYRLNDPDGADPADSSGNGNTGSTVGTLTYGQPSLVPTDSADTCIQVTGNRGILSAVTPTVYLSTGAGFSWAVTYKAIAGTPGLGWSPLLRWSDFDVDLSFTDYPTTVSIGVASVYQDTGFSSATLTDGNAHLVSGSFANGSQKLWIDGVLVATTTQAIATDQSGVAARFGYINSSHTLSGWYDEAIVHPNAIWTDAQHTDLYNSWSGGSTPAPPPPVAGSGYEYAGGGSPVDYDVPIMPAPAGTPPTPIKRVHRALPAPTFVNGRPQFGAPTVTVGKWADHLRVKIDGKDRTWVRGIRTVVTDWQLGDPYGWLSATLVLPSVTAFDDIENDPALSWLREGARVNFCPVSNGATVNPGDPPFMGLIDRIEAGASATVVSCSGWFNGKAAARMYQPPIMEGDAQDAGALLSDYLELHSRVTVLPLGGPVTGIPLAHGGSRDMTVLGWLDDRLGNMIREGGVSWTLLPDPKGTGYMRLATRSMAGVDATVDYGAHGVTVNVARDRLDMHTGVFGEGVTPAGERVRNAVYPRIVDAPVPTFPGNMSLGITNADTSTNSGVSVLARRLWALGLVSMKDSAETVFSDEIEDGVKVFQRHLNLTDDGVVTSSLWQKLWGEGFTAKSFRMAHFEEFSVDMRTQKWLRGPNGAPVDLNPSFDPDIDVVETFVSFGEGVTKRHMRKNAKAIRERGGDLTGTIVLTTDPAEMSRFDLRPGMKIQANYYRGSAGMKFYISSVQVGWGDSKQPVTLAVSTTAKHYLELAQIRQRNLDARKDVGKMARHQFRRSTQVADNSGGWEGESEAGVVEETALKGGQWNVLQVTAAQFGVMSNVVLTTDNAACAWWMSAHATEVEASVFNNVLGDPSTWRGTDPNQVDVWTDKFDWLRQPERLMIESWGDPDNMPGYFPMHHTNAAGKVTTHPITGRFEDHGSWDFISETGFIWLAIYPTANCTISGRFRVQLTGEGA